jgi:transposase
LRLRIVDASPLPAGTTTTAPVFASMLPTVQGVKAEIVELCQRGDRSVGQVARDFDLTETAVREWVKQADLDTGQRSDRLTSDERAELAALPRENRRLRRELEILKRATAFFANQSR